MKDPWIWVATVLTAIGIIIAPVVQPPWLLALLVLFFSIVLYLIPGARYLSFALIVIAFLYGSGLLPLYVFVSTLAIVVVGEVAFRSLEEKFDPYASFICASSASLLFVWFYLQDGTPLIAMMGVLVAVMLKSALKDREDTLMIEGLAVAMTMYLFYEINYQVSLTILFAAILIAFTFGFFSYRMKVADMSGLFSGALVGFILIVFTKDIRWFLVMLTFFILGSAATRYQFEFKSALGVAESHRGVRGYHNVFANGIVAVAAAVLYGISGHVMFIALFMGSVATAAADTVAGEIGMTSSNPYLITTLQRVPKGTNGGVTILGEFAALCASIIVVSIAYFLNVITLPMLAICAAAGFAGTHVDSIVGATLENRGVIGNMGTNFIATLLGGLIATLFFIG